MKKQRSRFYFLAKALFFLLFVLDVILVSGQWGELEGTCETSVLRMYFVLLKFNEQVISNNNSNDVFCCVKGHGHLARIAGYSDRFGLNT